MDERQILWITYLLAVLFIVLAVSVKLQNLADDTYFKQKFLAVDVANIEDSIMSAPGDVVFSYPLQEDLQEQFTFNFQECETFVSSSDQKIEQGSSFSCSEDYFLEKRGLTCFSNHAILVLINPE